MFYTVLGYYILFRICESVFNFIIAGIFRKIFKSDQFHSVEKSVKATRKGSSVTVSSSQPMNIPAEFDHWGQLEKARWITLYAIDTMFRTLTPIFTVLIEDDAANQKRLTSKN